MLVCQVVLSLKVFKDFEEILYLETVYQTFSNELNFYQYVSDIIVVTAHHWHILRKLV
jgi:hypothetical protein